MPALLTLCIKNNDILPRHKHRQQLVRSQIINALLKVTLIFVTLMLMDLTSSLHIHWNLQKITLGMARMMLSYMLESTIMKRLLKAKLIMTCTAMVPLDKTNFVKFKEILPQLFVLAGKQALLSTLELLLMES